jgi:hypothetical protein
MSAEVEGLCNCVLEVVSNLKTRTPSSERLEELMRKARKYLKELDFSTLKGVESFYDIQQLALKVVHFPSLL